MLNLFTSFITSFIITFFAIPSVINVAGIRKIFDEPNERKLHKSTIPALGGVAMFSGIFFSIMFWQEIEIFNQLRWIILSLVIIFLLGLKDDIVSIDPYKKLVGQIFASGIIIYYGDIRIHNLYGLFSIHELPYIVSVMLTLFTIIVIINSFNLIDGIDGLAGGIGAICSLSFGCIFFYNDQAQMAAIAFALAGALVAFLKYNFSPAKIFMGDGGSLVVGFLLSILCIELLKKQIFIDIEKLQLLNTPSLALAILIIPLADTLRVFIIRIINKKSPFQADRNHIHHLLLQLGLNHKKASITLYSLNILFIMLSFAFNELGVNILFFLCISTAFVLIQVLNTLILRKEEENKRSKDFEVFFQREESISKY